MEALVPLRGGIHAARGAEGKSEAAPAGSPTGPRRQVKAASIPGSDARERAEIPIRKNRAAG
jgi:hypothetical protein